MNEWEDLEDEAREAAYPGPKCGVWIMLSALDGNNEAQDAIRRTLANHRLTSSSIHKALSTRLPTSDLASVQSLNRHRRGACNCPKEES